jgi:hypothetical protein
MEKIVAIQDECGSHKVFIWVYGIVVGHGTDYNYVCETNRERRYSGYG